MCFQDVSEDALVWVAIFMNVRDCFLPMMILRRRGLPLWIEPELNVDGTRAVDRLSPFHHALVSDYMDHLKSHQQAVRPKRL